MGSSRAGITVLVPTVGRMDFLPMTRRCVAEQTRKDFRVIVLDNASPPEAQAFFDDWKKKDDRVEIHRADPRVPMFENFNRGMRAVETELVTFFHDDDEYAPDYLEVLAGALERFPGAAFAGSNWDFIDADGNVTEERRWIAKTEHWDAPRYMQALIGRGRNPVPMPGLVFRRSAFGSEGFDATLPIYYGDFVLLMRAAESGGMIAVDKPVVRIRRHAGQESAKPLSMGIALRTELMNAYLDEYASRHPGDRELVDRLRGRVALSHRAGMLWGWVVARDESEWRKCLDALGDRGMDDMLRRVLGWAGAKGIRPTRVSTRFVKVARSAASALRL
jgi:glycosyltransferase involved in cell wall biosynthesis